MNDSGILQGDDINEDNQFQKAIQRADTLYQTVKRITCIDKMTFDGGEPLKPYQDSPVLSKLAIYLINKIEDKKWN